MNDYYETDDDVRRPSSSRVKNVFVESSEKAVRSPDVMRPGTAHAMMEMDERIGFLAERVKMLQIKLGPILGPVSDGPDGGTAPPPEVSEIANKLYGQIFALQSLAYQISEITERVDL
jgi:hypothetical protein